MLHNHHHHHHHRSQLSFDISRRPSSLLPSSPAVSTRRAPLTTTSVLPTPPPEPAPCSLLEPKLALQRLSTSSDGLVLHHVPPAWSLDFFARLDSLPRTDPRYRLRYSYNAAYKSFITKCMPSPVHDAFQEYLFTSIVGLRDRFNLTRNEGQRLRLTSGTDVRAFKGAYQGSRKCANVMIMSRDDDDDDDDAEESEFPTVVVEVGFSEPYELLKRDVALWLEGSEGLVKAAILINFIESPKVDLTQFWRENKKAPDNKPEQTARAETTAITITPKIQTPLPADPPFGPIIRNTHALVGNLTCTLEVWRLNPQTKCAEQSTRTTVLPPPPPPPTNNIPPSSDDSFTLTMEELYGASNIPESCKPDEKVKFGLEPYRKRIKRAVRMLARHRLVEVEGKKTKFDSLKRAREGAKVEEDTTIPINRSKVETNLPRKEAIHSDTTTATSTTTVRGEECFLPVSDSSSGSGGSNQNVKLEIEDERRLADAEEEEGETRKRLRC